jgi:very-short-patch-repair endonuclease
MQRPALTSRVCLKRHDWDSALVRPMRTYIARDLRHNMNGVERRLWARLRLRKLDGWKFRRQAPIGDYVVDFVCLQARLIIELDGPVHDERRWDADLRRQAWLEAKGFRVKRFSASFNTEEALDDVVATIRLELADAAWEARAPSPRFAGTSPSSGEETTLEFGFRLDRAPHPPLLGPAESLGYPIPSPLDGEVRLKAGVGAARLCNVPV